MATRSYDVQIRPMRPDDVAAAEALSAAAYGGVAGIDADPTRVPVLPRSIGEASAWQQRTRHLLTTDPGGSWVAEIDGEMVGFAVGLVRELMWILASYAVLPSHQGQGIGREILSAAAQHGRGCLRGMLASSADPGATRRYRAAGFDLHPFMQLQGTVDRTTLPILDRVRAGGAADHDLLDSIDRRTRGAAHGPDHGWLFASSRLIVADRSTGSGYAYLGPDGSLLLLAATNRRTATDLLWEALAAAPPDTEVCVDRITAANQWAIDVGMAAGLGLHPSGYLALRHLKPPAPYLPHRAFL